MTATMRALRAHDLTGPPGLWVDEIPIPDRPDDDAVRIDVHAAGVGFVDTLVTRGLYQVRQGPPYIPGMEVSGVVSDAPEGSGLRVGQRVIGSVPAGGCAETVWAPGHAVAPLAEVLTFADGASMVVNYHTALLGLTRRAGLRSGERVLVHGAGGGLGSAFVQVAVALGAQVIAVAGSPKRRALARTAGAQLVHDQSEWFDAIRADGGVDVIVDPVGGDVFTQSVRCLAPEGRLLTVGYASGQIPGVAANRLLLRNSAVVGVNWAGLVHAEPGLFRETAEQLDGLVAAGMTPVPSTAYRLADAKAAFTAIENRDSAGKTVLLVRDPGAVAA